MISIETISRRVQSLNTFINSLEKYPKYNLYKKRYIEFSLAENGTPIETFRSCLLSTINGKSALDFDKFLKRYIS